jgi:hypothetical protein
LQGRERERKKNQINEVNVLYACQSVLLCLWKYSCDTKLASNGGANGIGEEEKKKPGIKLSMTSSTGVEETRGGELLWPSKNDAYSNCGGRVWPVKPMRVF